MIVGHASLVEGRLDYSSGSYLLARDLRFSYPPKSLGLASLLRRKSIPALRGVNLGLGRGHILLITGPNGSGKTTLLAMLSGLLKPDSGTLRLGGADANPRILMRRTSILLGDRPPYFGKLRVRSLLTMLSDLFGTDILALAGDLGLPVERYVHTLSRGQLSRLAYAIWLGKPAEVYLGDEVAIGLDSDGTRALASIILKKAEEGSIFVLASPSDTELFSLIRSS